MVLMVTMVMMVIIVIKVTLVYFKNVHSLECKAVDMECLVCVKRAVVWDTMLGDLLCPLSGQRLCMVGFFLKHQFIQGVS